MRKAAFGLALLFTAPAFPQSAGLGFLYSATGPTASSIQNEVDRFRRDLGGQLNPNQATSFSAGRREINWDAVGGTQGNPDLPGDFFHRVSPRGLIMSTPGSRLKVSGDPGSPSFSMRDVTREESGIADFTPFSGQKFFAPLGSTITDVEFRVPGSDEVACVTGFGAVFMDVDRGGQTFMEVALLDGSIRRFYVPVQPVAARGFSFVGVRFPNSCIVTVRLNSGDTQLDTISVPPPSGLAPVADTVAIDDFIYSEPQPVSRRSAL